MHNHAKIIQCPACKLEYRNRSVIYWLEKDVKTWSDGFKSNDIAHEYPIITRCDECYHYFWISGVRLLEHNGPRMIQIAINQHGTHEPQTVPVIRKLKPEEYGEVLALKNYRDNGEEKYLRTHLWWSINTPLRNGMLKDIAPDLKPLFEENLETLIYKTPAESPDKLFTLAELHRELGLFNEALSYLDQLSGNGYGKSIPLMKQKILNQDRRVFIL